MNSFLSDLGEGIFSRLGELRRDQDQKDQEQKLQTIKMLTGLYDRIEPESQPLLLQHIGSILNLKGPMRKFWASFSGYPDTSVEQQIGSKLNEVLSSTVVPQTAQQVRESYKGELLQPYREVGSRPRKMADLPFTTPPDLQGKLVFRDLRQEKLSELEEKYQAQSQLQADRLYLQDQSRKEIELVKQEGRKALEVLRYKHKIERAKRELAQSYLGSGMAETEEDADRMADTYLAGKSEAELDLINSRIGNLQARTGLTQARTRKTISTEKATPSRSSTKARGPINIGSQKLINAVKAFEGLKGNLSDAIARGDMTTAATLRKKLQSQATSLLSKYGDRLEGGIGDWPWLKIKTPQGTIGLVEQQTSSPSLSPEAQSMLDKLMGEGYSREEALQGLRETGYIK
jgi:hypothetical protein